MSHANIGRLQSLVDCMVREGGFLVLCGSDEGWRTIRAIRERRDFWQRIATSIELQPMSREFALDLVKLYLQEDVQGPAYSDPSDILPLTPDSVAEILRYGGGNARRFLYQVKMSH